MTFKNNRGIKFRFAVLVVGFVSGCSLTAYGEVSHLNKEIAIAYTNANILDPSIDLPIVDSTIVVSSGKIINIQPNSTPIPSNVKKIDLERRWVIPGLIDSHVHLAQSGGAFSRPDILDARKIVAYENEQNKLLSNHQKILKKYVRLGITSIYDLGGPTEYLPKYSTLSKRQHAPEIYFAGALLSPINSHTLKAHGATYAHVTTPSEALELAEQQIAKGSHILKIVWDHQKGQNSEQLFELFQPAISFAKSKGIVVAIHVEELDGAKWAVKVGADVIVHGVMRESIDDELIAMMLSNGVTYSPTLTAYEHYFQLFKGELSFNHYQVENALEETLESFALFKRESAKADKMFHMLNKYLPMIDKSEEELATLSPQERGLVMQLKTTFSEDFLTVQKSNLKKVISAGVNVSIGSDAGNIGTLHGTSLLGEMQAWQAAGISNKEIIKATTLGNALALKLEHSIGSLSSGNKANFIVLDDNPYKNLLTLQQPVQVYKQGLPMLEKKEQ